MDSLGGQLVRVWDRNAVPVFVGRGNPATAIG